MCGIRPLVACSLGIHTRYVGVLYMVATSTLAGVPAGAGLVSCSGHVGFVRPVIFVPDSDDCSGVGSDCVPLHKHSHVCVRGSRSLAFWNSSNMPCVSLPLCRVKPDNHFPSARSSPWVRAGVKQASSGRGPLYRPWQQPMGAAVSVGPEANLQPSHSKSTTLAFRPWSGAKPRIPVVFDI